MSCSCSVLLARISLVDAFKNPSQMDVRRAPNSELRLSLDCESMQNLRGRDLPPPPAFCRESDADTVDAVLGWVSRSYRTVTKVERAPSAVRPASAPAVPRRRKAPVDAGGGYRVTVES